MKKWFVGIRRDVTNGSESLFILDEDPALFQFASEFGYGCTEMYTLEINVFGLSREQAHQIVEAHNKSVEQARALRRAIQDLILKETRNDN